MSSCTQELIERNNQIRQISAGENLLHLQPLLISELEPWPFHHEYIGEPF